MWIGARQEQIIRCVLGLINTDIRELDRREIASLIRSFLAFGTLEGSFGELDHVSSHDFSREVRNAAFKKAVPDLVQYQSILKTFFLGMMNTMQEHKNRVEHWRKMIEEGHASPPLAADIPERGTLDVLLEPALDPKGDPYNRMAAPWPLGPLEDYRIALAWRSENYQEKILNDFLKAFAGLPPGAFRQCEECRGWFLHTSQKRRSFCSPQCRVRRGSRKSYIKLKEKDAERFEARKASGRERAKKSYNKRKARKKED